MIGIIGYTEIAKHQDNNKDSINITRYGSAKHKYIPPVIVVCEDRLSELVIRQIEDLNVEVIHAGSWNNFTTLLYGINFYRAQLDGVNDLLPEIVCVIDGDIQNSNVINRIKETHCGRNSNIYSKIIKKIESDIVSFALEYEVGSNNKGIPEFNHKNWLDSIDESIVTNHFSTRLERLRDIQQVSNDEYKIICQIEISNIEKEIEETIRIINASKSIKFDQKKGCYFDYHKYYNMLSRALENGDTFLKYMIHEIEYTVLSIIKKYNNQAWLSYINDVKIKVEEKCSIHQEKFKHDYLNGKKFKSKTSVGGLAAIVTNKMLKFQAKVV